MIALDTNSLVHYLAGSRGPDVEAVELALAESQACLPPVVLSEILSDPTLPRNLEKVVLQIPTLEATGGYWERAGRLRARVIRSGHKAKLADTLIAQSCLDHNVLLVTRDRDFRHFVVAGLRLLPVARR
ncbi:MAG: PIN domain-containing protein [Vicinamibacteria bacterium]